MLIFFIHPGSWFRKKIFLRYTTEIAVALLFVQATAGFVKTHLLPIPSFRALPVHGMLGHTIMSQLQHVCKTVFSVTPVIETDCFQLRALVCFS